MEAARLTINGLAHPAQIGLGIGELPFPLAVCHRERSWNLIDPEDSAATRQVAKELEEENGLPRLLLPDEQGMVALPQHRLDQRRRTGEVVTEEGCAVINAFKASHRG